ncbi:hypothetical protein ABZT23_24120 [Streptomyces sp. NPDC005386]|uniref:hypothetical protein n=1 Tax=Streptomyces sp. NPDC005386 TaxID=3154562 RepID=UPI0033B105C2
MANDSAASSARKRLTRKTPPKQPDPPEVALARSLLTTEYAVRGARPGSESRSGKGQSAWDQLADELARFIDRLRGRSPSAGGAPGGGGGGDTGGVGQAEPHAAQAMRSGSPQQPLSAGSMLSSRAAFEGTIDQLPPSAREAFEDAVLHLVRTEKKWKKAYDKAPAGMPSVAMYANNAYLRELRRDAPPGVDAPTREQGRPGVDSPPTVTASEAMTDAGTAIMAQDQVQFDRLRARWERPAPAPEDSATTSARSSFGYPGESEMSDGNAFQEAQRAQYAWSTDNSRNPGQDQASDAVGFRAAEEARLERITGNLPGPTPTPAQEAEQAHHAWNQADFTHPAREPMSDGNAFLASENSRLSGDGTTLSFAPPNPLSPVSPLLPSTLPAANGQQSLLGSEGHAALRDSIASVSPASTSRDAGTPTRPAGTPPVRKTSTVSTARRA